MHAVYADRAVDPGEDTNAEAVGNRPTESAML